MASMSAPVEVWPWNSARQLAPGVAGGVKLLVVLGSPPRVQLTLLMVPDEMSLRSPEKSICQVEAFCCSEAGTSSSWPHTLPEADWIVLPVVGKANTGLPDV